MAVNMLGIGWKITNGNRIVVHVVLIVLLSSFAQSEKEPVDSGSAKSHSPSSEVCYQAAFQYFFLDRSFFINLAR
jgi:hypothetical protein